MKTLRPLLIMATACLGIWACSDDDNDNNNNNGNDHAGTYALTSVEVPVANDFDMDGTASANMMDESPCYLDSEIVLSDDNTYTDEYHYVLHESETGCHTEEALGTWEVDGEMILLTNTLVEPTPSPIEYHIQDNTLVRVYEGPYPDRDDDDNPIYTTGTITLTYTKTVDAN